MHIICISEKHSYQLPETQCIINLFNADGLNCVMGKDSQGAVIGRNKLVSLNGDREDFIQGNGSETYPNK